MARAVLYFHLKSRLLHPSSCIVRGCHLAEKRVNMNSLHAYIAPPLRGGSKGGGGRGGANDGKGEWGVPPPTQSQEAFAIKVAGTK